MPVEACVQTLRRASVAAALKACAKNEWLKDLVLAYHVMSNTPSYVQCLLNWKRSVELSEQDIIRKRLVHEQTLTLLPDFFSQTLHDAVVLRIVGLIEQVQVFAGASAQVLCVPSVYTNFSYRNLEISRCQGVV